MKRTLRLLVTIVAMVFLIIPFVQSQLITDNLFCYYNFSTSTPASFNSTCPTGIVNGATHLSTGDIVDNGGSFSFDGINDFIELESNSNLSLSGYNFSLFMWVNTSETTEAMLWATDVSGSRGTVFKFQPSIGHYRLSDEGTGQNTASLTNSAEGTWAWIGVTFNHNTRNTTIYFNGTSPNSEIEASVYSLSTAITMIGKREFVGSERFYGGAIDEIALWKDRILSATEVQNVFNNYSAGIRPTDSLVPPPPPDSIPPSFVNDSINNTSPKINEVVGLSIVITDDTALSNYRFAHNTSGTFVNSTPFTISGTDVNATFNLTVTASRGNVVGYQWHSEDSTGNANTSSIFGFTVENTAPETPTIIFPTNNLETFVQPLALNVTFPNDADSDAITISYYINDILNATSSSNVTFTAGDLDYNLKVSLSDGFASSANATVNFTIDTTNPIITITLPANNTIHNANITVNISCINLNLVNLSYVFFNSTDIVQTEFNDATNVTESFLTQFIDTSGIGNGAYQLNVSCIDNSTNTDFKFINLNFDNTAPVITGLTINQTNGTAGDIIEVSATCSDANLDTIDVQFNSTGAFVTEESAINLGTDITFLHNETVIEGFIAHRFICNDTLNQSSTSGLLTYTGFTVPSIPLITGAVVFPLENAVSLVGMVALFLLILGLLFKFLPSRGER